MLSKLDRDDLYNNGKGNLPLWFRLFLTIKEFIGNLESALAEVGRITAPYLKLALISVIPILTAIILAYIFAIIAG